MNVVALQTPSIGDQITAACNEKGWDLGRLATESGVPLKYLNRYKNGSVPGPENLAKLQSVLGTKFTLEDGTKATTKDAFKKPHPLDSPLPKTNWSFSSDQAELTVNIEQNNFEMTARYGGSEVRIKPFLGLRVKVVIGNGDAYEIEPEADHLRVSCQGKSMFVSSGGGRNVMSLKQLE